MRLFTGISIPPRVSTVLESLIAELKPSAQLRWSPVENLHITTKFIGEWPDANLPAIGRALAGVKIPDFSVKVARFGFLPNPHRPKIFFAGVRGEAGLSELAHATEASLAELGIAREPREFTPHITLARIANENVGALREKIAALTAADPGLLDFGAFPVTDFHLYRSKTGPSGSSYSILSSYPLEKAAK